MLHAGDPDEPALRGYLALGAPCVQTIDVPRDRDVLDPLAALLSDYALVLCGSRGESGMGSGLLPYLLAQRLGRPLLPNVLSAQLAGGAVRAQAGPAPRHGSGPASAADRAPRPSNHAMPMRGSAPGAYCPLRRARAPLADAWRIEPADARRALAAPERRSGRDRLLAATAMASRGGEVIQHGSPEDKARAVLAYLRTHNRLITEVDHEHHRPAFPIPPARGRRTARPDRQPRSGPQPGRAVLLSQQVFDLDMEAIFARHWIHVAVEPDIPEPGDYITVDVGRHSVVIVRDDDQQIRAFHNVCRHRGSRLCQEQQGSVGNLVCPYHQWTYTLDGKLAYAEHMGAGFDKRAHGLKPVHVQSLAGLLFICLADAADRLRPAARRSRTLSVAAPSERLQDRRADRHHRGRQLETHHGEQPRVLSLRGEPP